MTDPVGRPDHPGWHAIGDGQRQRETDIAQQRATEREERLREHDWMLNSLHRYAGLMAAAQQPPTTIFVDRPSRSALTSWARKVPGYVVVLPYDGGAEGPARCGIAVTADGDVVVLRRPTRHDAPEGHYAVGESITAAVAGAMRGVSAELAAEQLDEVLVSLLRHHSVAF